MRFFIKAVLVAELINKKTLQHFTLVNVQQPLTVIVVLRIQTDYLLIVLRTNSVAVLIGELGVRLEMFKLHIYSLWSW